MNREIKDVEERIQLLSKEIEECSERMGQLTEEQNELKLELSKLKPNFYFTKIYTRKGYDDKYILLLDRGTDNVELYNISTNYYWVTSKNMSTAEIVKNTISFDTMNYITQNQAHDFKPLEI